jgi:vacuolar protein sorting-associated protein 41
MFLCSISMSVGQVRNLLEHTVGNLDPLYIVNLVPDGLELTRYASIKIYRKKNYKLKNFLHG